MPTRLLLCAQMKIETYYIDNNLMTYTVVPTCLFATSLESKVDATCKYSKSKLPCKITHYQLAQG
jgi:hypothetical protein